MLHRRAFLLTGAAASLVTSKPARALVWPERRVFLANPYTGETFHDVYWLDGEYVPESLQSIDRLMRDHRTDEISLDQNPWMYGIACELVTGDAPQDLIPPYNMLHYNPTGPYFER